MTFLATYGNCRFVWVLEDEERTGYISIVQGLNPENMEAIYAIGCCEDRGPYKLLKKAFIEGRYINVDNIQIGEDGELFFETEGA